MNLGYSLDGNFKFILFVENIWTYSKLNLELVSTSQVNLMELFFEFKYGKKIGIREAVLKNKKVSSMYLLYKIARLN